MASYKVIQDIEAEDKLLGPLTLRQFVYAAITLTLGFVIFRTITTLWFLSIFLLPPAIFFAFLAAPFGRDQPSEVWMLAKVRFSLKPRRRIWNQSGVSELVTVTAPKTVERSYTDGLSLGEVRDKLEALANTIDSRGWVIQNSGGITPNGQPTYLPATRTSSRLIDPSTAPHDVPSFDLNTVVDIMDEQTNPTAQNFDRMIAASTQNQRQKIETAMQQAAVEQPPEISVVRSEPPQQTAQKTNNWFVNPVVPVQDSGISPFDNPVVIGPQIGQGDIPITLTTADEQALLKKVHEEQSKPLPTLYHMDKKEPISGELLDKPYDLEKPEKLPKPVKKIPVVPAHKPQPVSQAVPVPAILNLARNNDLDVATIARELQRESVRVQTLDNEVIVSLHYHEPEAA